MKVFIPGLFVPVLFLLNFVYAQDSTKIEQLEKRLEFLEKKLEQSELDDILNEANSISREKKEDKKSKTFKSGQRSLQAINPEISITGDMFGLYIPTGDHFTKSERSGAHFRGIGLHIQSNLDPFSLAKVAIGFSPHGVGLGEAYITLTKVVTNVSLTIGKFRQQFGVVNRWHKHALDQFDFPLAISTIFGDHGLNQIGFSVDWLLPSFIGDANNLIIQITNGQNEQLFSGEAFSFPAALAHFKSYYDLTQNTYLEFGLTGMLGKNNVRSYGDSVKIFEPTRYTKLAGLDLTLFWEPVDKALYKSFIWRSELYYSNKEQTMENIETLGGYTYAEYQFDERWQAGLRLDYTQPFKTNNSGLYLYQIVPYVTWWQSHWVKFRFEYNYLSGNDMAETEQYLRLQLVWAMGPHKHERY